MKLSLLVCTRNRVHSITHCLDSIAAALKQAMPITAEIVVVDNGSTDGTSAVVQNWAKSCEFPVKLVYENRKGVAVARNRAVHESSGTLLLFTDDDCRLDQEYVVTALLHDSADAEELVLRGGRVELGDPTDFPVSILTSRKPKTWRRRDRSARQGNLGGTLLGASLMMRRALADHLGRFDERFGTGGRFHGGEEIDYLYRAYLAGIRIDYTPDMIVYHYHGRKTLGVARDLVCKYNIGDGALVAKFLFTDSDLIRPFYWDIKKAIKEIFGGAYSRPDLNISHRKRVMDVLHGMSKYYLVCLLSRLRKRAR